MVSIRLPPLKSLRAFEATARLASFKAAAEELFVTPTAISHQIRQLEDYLGVRVLDRTPRAVALTAQGAVLYEATAAGFAGIGKVVGQLRGTGQHATVTLSSTPAFLSQWMAPRMGELRRLHPDIDLRLHTSDAIVELGAGGIEAAIRYGSGTAAGVASIALRKDVFIPVCSPRLGVSKPADLRRVPLIHVDGFASPASAPDWPRWCAKAGLTGVDTQAGLRFPDSLLATQAAIAGLGVAIISRTLVADALATGLLDAPFEETLAGATYHFACAEDIEGRADIVSLRNWFVHALSA